jgi:hypothetical protein
MIITVAHAMIAGRLIGEVVWEPDPDKTDT